jgi:hypothetical protein
MKNGSKIAFFDLHAGISGEDPKIQLSPPEECNSFQKYHCEQGMKPARNKYQTFSVLTLSDQSYKSWLRHDICLWAINLADCRDKQITREKQELIISISKSTIRRVRVHRIDMSVNSVLQFNPIRH